MRIAICGKLCSGKSYLAKFLAKEYNAEIYSFGYGVKRYCKEIFDMKYKDRKLLQNFAQKMREIDNDVWVKYTMNKINIENKPNIIVDDLRFPNELEHLESAGFVIIRLIVDKPLQINRIKKTYPETYGEHIDRLEDVSETYIEKMDIKNTIYVDEHNEKNIIDLVKTCLKIDLYK